MGSSFSKVSPNPSGPSGGSKASTPSKNPSSPSTSPSGGSATKSSSASKPSSASASASATKDPASSAPEPAAIPIDPDTAYLRKKLLWYLKFKHRSQYLREASDQSDAAIDKIPPYDEGDANNVAKLEELVHEWGTVEGVMEKLGFAKDKFITIKLIINAVEEPPSWIVKHFQAKFSRYGGVHVDLQINDKLIGWFNCSLVRISKLANYTAAAALDVAGSPGNYKNQIEVTTSKIRAVRPFIGWLIDGDDWWLMIDDDFFWFTFPWPFAWIQIAECIVKWNRKETYTLAKQNCHDFSDAILKAAGITPNWPDCVSTNSRLTGPFAGWFQLLVRLEKYFEDIKRDPVQGSKPHIPEADGTVTWFDNHHELDNYIRELQTEPKRYDLAMPLLRAFDRAFKIQEEKEGGGQLVDNQTCPFGNLTKFQTKKAEVIVANAFFDDDLMRMPMEF